MKIIAYAEYLGPDDKGRERGGRAAVIELPAMHAGCVEFVRLFSLSPKDVNDATVINTALNTLLRIRDNYNKLSESML